MRPVRAQNLEESKMTDLRNYAMIFFTTLKQALASSGFKDKDNSAVHL